MKIVLTTLGTAGDVRPFVALARALAGRGHEPCLLAPALYAAQAGAHGVCFSPTPPDVSAASLRARWERVERAGPARQLDLVIREFFLDDAERRYETCLATLRGADVAVCHSLDFAGQQAARTAGIPVASVVFCPGVLPTAVASPLHGRSFGRIANRLLWRTFGLASRPFERGIERRLAALGGPPPRIGLAGTRGAGLTLLAHSPQLATAPPDAPSGCVVTGAWILEEGAAFTADEPLARFLDDGPPDVVVTFGSMGGERGAETARLLVDAAERTGARTVIQRGWGGIDAQSRPGRIVFTGEAPHERLFAGARVIVHHGGAGTSWAACRAGAASVTVPHVQEQRYWGEMLRRLGVAEAPIPRGRLRAAPLARAIVRMLEDARALERAAALAEHLAVERGPETATLAIERWRGGAASPPSW